MYDFSCSRIFPNRGGGQPNSLPDFLLIFRQIHATFWAIFHVFFCIFRCKIFIQEPFFRCEKWFFMKELFFEASLLILMCIRKNTHAPPFRIRMRYYFSWHSSEPVNLRRECLHIINGLKVVGGNKMTCKV